jgi:hypothetical protein
MSIPPCHSNELGPTVSQRTIDMANQCWASRRRQDDGLKPRKRGKTEG